MPLIDPLVSERNLTPSSTGESGPASAVPGKAEQPQKLLPAEQFAPATDTLIPVEGNSRFPLSSTARLRMVNDPFCPGCQEYVQFSRPLAGCHVVPPSTETSTPPTTPPPISVAVPEMLTVLDCIVEPPLGEVIVELGAVASVDAEAATRPVCRVAGRAPRSANKFTVACCIRESVG